SLVKELIAPPADCPGYELQKGSVTDSFATAYCLLKSFLKNGISYESAVAGLLDFKYGETSRYYDVFASGTDRYSMEFIEGTHVFNRFDKVPCEHRRHSNEAASRAWVAGILNPGDVRKAVRDALIMSLPTHGNAIAMSGAAVVAALTAAALGGSRNVVSLYELALETARSSYQEAEQMIHITSVGSKLEARIRKAFEIACEYEHDDEKLIAKIQDMIGTGTYTSEVVPSSIGFLMAAKGDVERALYLSANAGNQTNRTAVITAVISCCISGSDSLAERYLEEVRRTNAFYKDL
ncbi:MAG: ADP-ribosylglycohydrolase family protein, partial [Erysipelotrichaceae bacterium]|nr:ADP-ribosylglycohydrolase family protein [Erysipelotrichaceae bacterium]